MSGPFVWWANRKSKMGLKPSAKPPPHLPGKGWWTTPPTTLPQPEHIEYVQQFFANLLAQPPSQERNAMQTYIAQWMKAARRLLHEEMYAPERADLHTTDGLLIAADDTIKLCILACHRAGVRLPDEVFATQHALQRRTGMLRRERAIDSAHHRTKPATGVTPRISDRLEQKK